MPKPVAELHLAYFWLCDCGAENYCRTLTRDVSDTLGRGGIQMETPETVQCHECRREYRATVPASYELADDD